MLNHKCGQCEIVFKTEKDYLKHKCSTSGFTPKQNAHLPDVYQSPPPKISESPSEPKISEDEILKAVKEARHNRQT